MQYTKAIEVLTQLLEINPKYIAGYLNRAKARRKQQDYLAGNKRYR